MDDDVHVVVVTGGGHVAAADGVEVDGRTEDSRAVDQSAAFLRAAGEGDGVPQGNPRSANTPHAPISYWCYALDFLDQVECH